MSGREGSPQTDWTTALRDHGGGTWHGVFFVPRADNGGGRPSVALLIPEGLASFDWAMRRARRRRARVMLLCDTREQAQDAAAAAAKALPGHCRLPIERAAAGAFGASLS